MSTRHGLVVAPSRRREVVVQLAPISVDVPTAASVVGISPAMVRAEIKAGALRARLVGRRMVVTVADLEAYIDSRPVAA